MVVVDIEVISDVVCVVKICTQYLEPKQSKRKADALYELSGATSAKEIWTKPSLSTRKPIREAKMMFSKSRGDRIISTITRLHPTASTSAN